MKKIVNYFVKLGIDINCTDVKKKNFLKISDSLPRSHVVLSTLIDHLRDSSNDMRGFPVQRRRKNLSSQRQTKSSLNRNV